VYGHRTWAAWRGPLIEARTPLIALATRRFASDQIDTLVAKGLELPIQARINRKSRSLEPIFPRLALPEEVTGGWTRNRARHRDGAVGPYLAGVRKKAP